VDVEIEYGGNLPKRGLITVTWWIQQRNSVLDVCREQHQFPISVSKFCERFIRIAYGASDKSYIVVGREGIHTLRVRDCWYRPGSVSFQRKTFVTQFDTPSPRRCHALPLRKRCLIPLDSQQM